MLVVAFGVWRWGCLACGGLAVFGAPQVLIVWFGDLRGLVL